MKSLFSILVCLLMVMVVAGQPPKGLLLVQSRGIPVVTITDSAMRSLAGEFIQRQETADTVFKKYGYISAVITRADKADKSLCLKLTVSYYYFYPDQEAHRYPVYITEINGRLVLIYDPVVSHLDLSNKIRKRFCKKVNARLAPMVIQKMKDEHGKVRRLRPVGDISHGQATVLCQ